MRVRQTPKKVKDRPKAKITGKAKDRRTAKVKVRVMEKVPTHALPVHISEEEQEIAKKQLDERRRLIKEGLAGRKQV